MAPEAGSESHGFISEWGNILNKLCKCNDSGLFQAVHTFSDFKVDAAIGFDGEVILVHYLLWNKGGVDTDVF